MEGKNRVVIVGGGFCGAMVGRHLDSVPEVEVTLVDPETTFDYIPGIPRIPFVEGTKDQLTIPYHSFLQNTRLVQARAKKVTPESVITDEEQISFDYCVVATGAYQPIQLDDGGTIYPMIWVDDAEQIRNELPDACRILVVGGGVLGTEVAAELATRAPEKRVTLAHGVERLLERNPAGASEYAQRFLETCGVDVILDSFVVDYDGEKYVLQDGRRLGADLVIWCTGPRPNPPAMMGFDDTVYTEAQALCVNNKLQLRGSPNIFVGGDVTSIEEEKTAQNAEHHAELISRNVLASIRGEPLEKYKHKEGPLIISLGGRCGLMTYRKRYIAGLIPGLLKWGVEYAILSQYEGFF